MFVKDWKTRYRRQIGAPSGQHFMSSCPPHKRIFDFKRHSCGSAAPLLPDLSPCAFFLFPELKTALKGTSFRDFRKYPKECHRHAEDHTGWRCDFAVALTRFENFRLKILQIFYDIDMFFTANDSTLKDQSVQRYSFYGIGVLIDDLKEWHLYSQITLEFNL